MRTYQNVLFQRSANPDAYKLALRAHRLLFGVEEQQRARELLKHDTLIKVLYKFLSDDASRC